MPAFEGLLEVTGGDLFRRFEIALASQVEPIINQNVRLKLVRELPKARRIPVAMVFAELAGVGEVEPDDADLAVVGQQLANLIT